MRHILEPGGDLPSDGRHQSFLGDMEQKAVVGAAWCIIQGNRQGGTLLDPRAQMKSSAAPGHCSRTGSGAPDLAGERTTVYDVDPPLAVLAVSRQPPTSAATQ